MTFLYVFGGFIRTKSKLDRSRFIDFILYLKTSEVPNDFQYENNKSESTLGSSLILFNRKSESTFFK